MSPYQLRVSCQHRIVNPDNLAFNLLRFHIFISETQNGFAVDVLPVRQFVDGGQKRFGKYLHLRSMRPS
jgi:hypothetical protein